MSTILAIECQLYHVMTKRSHHKVRKEMYAGNFPWKSDQKETEFLMRKLPFGELKVGASLDGGGGKSLLFPDATGRLVQAHLPNSGPWRFGDDVSAYLAIWARKAIHAFRKRRIPRMEGIEIERIGHQFINGWTGCHTGNRKT